ncbi:MAG: GNAT family N-acetyltransferase [Ruminococcus sp.]
MIKLTLTKAVFSDCEQIHKMQVSAFAKLLEKYRDFDTNPASESLEKIQNKFNQSFTDYYFIILDKTKIGVVRVAKLSDTVCRISPMLILPEYQNKGYAQQALSAVEKLYPNVNEWKLDTIKEESRLCHLYEKCGYTPTGKEEILKDGMTIVYYCKRV